MTGGQRLISWLHPCSTSNVALNTRTCAHGPRKIGSGVTFFSTFLKNVATFSQNVDKK
jgi:hypothetical protein